MSGLRHHDSGMDSGAHVNRSCVRSGAGGDGEPLDCIRNTGASSVRVAGVEESMPCYHVYDLYGTMYTQAKRRAARV